MQRRSFLKSTVGLALVAAGSGRAATAEPEALERRAHRIEVDGPLLIPDDGLVLGNGDLSVSVYQTLDAIVWRLGKGDVWDRRLDLSEDPRPADINEIAHGILDEGWSCRPYAGHIAPVALKGTKDPRRMNELCQGTPPSEDRRPYPCPKPVGELAMHLPADAQGLRIKQCLEIEQAKLTVDCTWDSGMKLVVECFIPPEPNVVVVRWKAEKYDREGPPVWWSLYRRADPEVAEFCAQRYAQFRSRLTGSGRMCDANPKVTPLQAPVIRQDGEFACIEQAFPPDPLFPQGFRYLLAPLAAVPENTFQPLVPSATGEARIQVRPKASTREGWLAVAVATNRDAANPEQVLRKTAATLARDAMATLDEWARSNRRSADAFWSRSAVRIADRPLETLWYETLHACRSIYHKGTVPPGLFLPSTVKDYSLWHGDYHLNYNFQEPFWGHYTANQVEMGDVYFEGVKYFLETGRKIAHDYYHCRGTFLQLSGYPVKAEDDWLGVAPMGRMAYMTGWAMNQYWWRYAYTLDKEWLRDEGYPVIRDCALFYADFMKKGADGRYHVFPSNQGEDGFTGNPKDYTDRAQVMGHLRYCLRCAIRASEALGSDEDLRALWRERLEHCAGDEGKPPLALAGLEKERYEANPYEFAMASSEARPGRDDQAWPGEEDDAWKSYFGKYPWQAMQRLRCGAFRPEKDYARFREMVARWRHPNGLVWAMAVARCGWAGAWTESLGVIAPLQEMMLQSWEGAIRLFPAWPQGVEARFEGLRAEGAFLVSAAWVNGEVQRAQIHSEKGALCQVYPPWPAAFEVIDDTGRKVEVTNEAYGRVSFPTHPGQSYRLLHGEHG